MELSGNWSVLDLSDRVAELCAPIKKHFDITYFNYVRLNKDNSRCLLTDRPEWISLFYQEKFYNAKTTLDIEAFKYQQYFSWEKLKDEFTFQEALKHNIGNGITLLEQSEDYLDLYWFGTSNDNRFAVNSLENNIDAFQRFILYFKDKGSKVLKDSYSKPIPFTDYSNEKSEFVFNTVDEFITTFIDSENRRFAYDHDGETRFLSKQETICASYLILQYSMQEIAVKMNLSPRTIETYLNNIKNKLRCASKSNLISELHNLKIVNVNTIELDENLSFYSYNIQKLLTLKEYLEDTLLKRLYMNKAGPNMAYLTKRECELIFYFCCGLNSKNIATKVNCTVKTVESYLEQLRSKFLVKKKSDLVAACVSSGLFHKIMIAFPNLTDILNYSP